MVNRFFDRDELERLLLGAGTTLRNAPLMAGQSIADLQRALQGAEQVRQGSLGFFTGRTPRESLAQGVQGLAGRRTFRPEDVGFARLMPEGSRQRRYTGAVLGEAVNPINYAGAAVRGLSFAPKLNLARRAAVEGLAAAGGGVAREGTYDITEGLPEPVRQAASTAAGIVGNLGVGVGAARAARSPAVGEFLASERAATELPDSFEGAIDALKRAINREVSLRRRGIPQLEVSEGRQVQAANVRRLFEEGQSKGLQGAELAAYARRGRAVGPMRRTVAEPLDVTPGQELQLYNRIFERYGAGEILDHDQANASYALNKLVKGEGIMPHERRLLRRAIPELADVIDDAPEGYQPPQFKPQRGSSKFLPGEEPDIPAILARLPGGGRPRRGSGAGLSRLSKQLTEMLQPKPPEQFTFERPAFQPRRSPEGALMPKVVGGLPSQQTVLPSRGSGATAQQRRLLANIGKPSELNRLRDVKIAQAQGDQFPTYERLVERSREVASKLAPEGKAKQVDDIIERWLNGSVVQADRLAEADSRLVELWNKHALGGTEDSAINAAFYQRNVLNWILREEGLDPRVAGKVTDDLFQALVSKKWDPENVGHYPVEIQRVFDELKGIPYEQAWGGFDTIVQQMKNTAFGLDGGLSFFGVQGLAALWRGSPALFFGSLNRALGKMHLPGYRELYMGESVPKAVQAALDGVHQGIGSSAVQGIEEVGSALEWVPLIGKQIDRPLQFALGKSTQFFFGTVLGVVRNAAYEGNLYMLQMAGRDISAPATRALAADYANTIGSFARTAVRASRAKVESRVLVSAPMRRAQVKHVEQMARIVDKGNPDQQILAASMILSTVAGPLIVGKAISDWFGIGEFQMDPTQPGFGQITFDNGRVVDVIPQDSVLSAIGKSVDALMGKDPAQIAKVWTQLAVGSTTHPVRAAFALAGVGYEPGAGFRMGDLTRSGQLLTSLPVPPVATGAISGEGLVPGDIALETLGLSSFPESATGLERRVLKNAGYEYDDLTATSRREILSKFGYLNEIEAKRLEERRTLAARGDRKAEALLVGADTRRLLDEARKISTRPDGTLDLADYRKRRSTIMAGHARVSEQFRDVFDGFSESKNPTEKLVGQYWDSVLKGSQRPDGSLDFEKFDQLEAAFAARVGQSNYAAVMAEVHALDPRDNPAEQRLQDIRQRLDSTGYWNIRDIAWERVRDRAGGVASLEDYRDEWVGKRAERFERRGLPREIALQRAELEFQNSSIKRRYDAINRRNRTAWIRDNRELAYEAMAAGYLPPSRTSLRAAS